MRTIIKIALLLLCVPLVAFAAGSFSEKFDGTNCLRANSTFTQYGAAAITVQAMIKTAGSQSFSMIVDENNGSLGTFQLEKGSTAAGYMFALATAGNINSPAAATTVVEDGKWHLITGTYDGANVHFYLDAVEQGAGTAQTGNINVANQTQPSVGCRAQTGIGKFNGLITDVRIYNVAHTASQIAADYQTRLAGTETGLTAYWKLNGVLTDSTANANTQLVSAGSATYTCASPFNTEACSQGLMYLIKGTSYIKGATGYIQ